LELVALRNATCERAFGLFPLLGLPAVGHEESTYTFDYALLFTEAGNWRNNKIPLIARNVFDNPWDATGRTRLRELASSIVTTDQPEVFVTAVKPASRGKGLIVRLCTPTSFGIPVVLTINDRPLKAAFLCDARERDLEPLQVKGQRVQLTMPGVIATIRLLS
jgi:alpha-mannosidase